MKIEFWSDIICPYCGLMDNRLRLALARFAHADETHVIHRSFQLHPDLPREGITQRRLLEVAGIPDSTAAEIFGQIEAAAKADGLEPYRALERTMGPTDLAHELLAYAGEQSRGGELWTAMFRAHFGQGRELWTADQVLGFAADAGLDLTGAAEALSSRRYRDRVAADQQRAERLGARGTPFIILDGKYTIAGAVSTDQLLTAMAQAWDKSHPTSRPVPILDVTEGACSPDTCAVPGTT